MAITRGGPISAADMSALFSLANTKLPGASPAYGSSGNWLAEVNRIRTALAAKSVLPDLVRRGPWGVDNVDTTLWAGWVNFRASGVVFPDGGSTPTLTSNADWTGSAMNDLYDAASRTGSVNVVESRITIVISADQPGQLSTRPGAAVGWAFQWSATRPVAANCVFESDIPGATFSLTFDSLMPTGGVHVAMNTAIDPGTYHIHFKLDPASDAFLYYWGDMRIGADGLYIPGTSLKGALLFSVSSTTKTAYNAIHSSLPVSVVAAPSATALTDGHPFGIWIKTITYGPSGPSGETWSGATQWWQTSSLLGGIWLAYACPMPTVTGELADSLPPNNPVDAALPVQKQAAPQYGTYTIESASNGSPIVVRVRGGSHWLDGQQVFISGVSGNDAANGLWSMTYIGQTTISGVLYTDFSLNSSTGSGSGSGGTAVLVVDSIIPVTPAITYRPARYPSARDTETPTSFAGASVSGICICDVLVRRWPEDNGNGVYLPPVSKPAQTVALGCMRSGSFVSFQTVTIPEGDDEIRIYPCWPVFTANALIYQSAARALVIATPFNTVAITGTVAGDWYPPSLLGQAMKYPISEQAVGGLMDILSDM